MSRRNQPYYGRNTLRYENQDQRPRHASDWERGERSRGHDEDWPGYGSRRPDERDYTARYLGYEARQDSPYESRYESSYNPYDDQRRSRRFEDTAEYEARQRAMQQRDPNRARYGAYGREHDAPDAYRNQTYRYGTREDFGSARNDWNDRDRDRDREDYRTRDYGNERARGYGQEHGHDWGQQLREAGHEMVRKVKRAFRGPKGYKRSDERIREDVNDRLAEQDHFDPGEIEVSVANGEVTLTGSVRTRQEKFLAEEIADDVSGVGEVHNQLRVRPETSSHVSPTSDTQTAAPGWSATTGGKNRNAHS